MKLPKAGANCRQMIVALALLWLLAGALAGCQGKGDRGGGSGAEQPQSGPVRISGKVAAVDSDEPVPYVQVAFFDLSGNQVGSPGNSDLSGRYQLELPPGRYHGVANIINPSHPLGWNGFAPSWTGGRPYRTPEGTVEVQPGQDLKIDFPLQRVRPCKGRVVLTGAAAVPALSSVAAVDAASGQYFAEVSMTSTGEYEFPLPDGEWLLTFNVPGFAQRTALKAVVAGSPVELPPQTLVPAA